MRAERLEAATTALVLCLAVAACSSPAPRDSANDAAAAGPVAGAPTPTPTAPAAAPSRSILRPEVVEAVPEEPPLRPVDATAGFDESGRVLTDEARATLDALAAGAAAQAGGAITLRGHSDSRGSDDANLRASRRRAETVRDYLAARGIDRARMTVIALGETTPLVPNALPDGRDDPAARRRNRRVDVHVALPAAAPTPAPASSEGAAAVAPTAETGARPPA